jgi:hypothetical protein
MRTMTKKSTRTTDFFVGWALVLLSWHGRH